jgi:PAS domain S-box-containing protein
VGVELAVTAALGPVLEALPTALLLIEPGTDNVVHANPAAHRLAGGEFPLGRLELAVAPAMARGETVANVLLDWRDRSLVVSGGPIALPDGEPITVLSLEDVTELEHTRADLRALLDGIADAITVQAPDLRVIYANTAAAHMYGLPDADAMRSVTQSDYAERFELTDEAGRAFDPALLPGRAALAGESAAPATLRFRDRRTGDTRWARIKASPVRDDAGRVRLAINVIEDITELKRSEEGQRFLAEASRTLASSLDYERTLATVADLAVAGIADWCVVDLVGDEGQQRVALAHPDAERRALAEELQRRYPPREEGTSAVARVMRSGRSEFVPRVTEEMLRAGAVDDEHLRLLRAVGLRSGMVVPMSIQGRVLGAITLVSSGREFDEHDLELAEDLALRAAVAVDNSRLYRTASEIARTLQTSLLPPHLPEVAGVELAAAYQPAAAGLEVGGDFYDVFSVADDQWYLVVGDVCGKGAEAAAITALVRHTVRSAAVRLRSPAAILRWAGDAMLRHEGGDGRFCTVACAHADFSGGGARVTVACGGHPLPEVLRADGTVEEAGAPGTLLGLVPDPMLQERTVELAPGDALVLYTDGLTEARAPAEVWGPVELAAVLGAAAGADAAGIVSHLVGAALGTAPAPRDDLAILALRRL